MLGGALMLCVLVSVLIHWGGTQSSASVLMSSLVCGGILLLIGLIHLCFTRAVDFGGWIFAPWVLSVFLSGLLLSVAPWDAWRTIVCQVVGGLVFYVSYALIRGERAKWSVLGGLLFLGVCCAGAAYYQAYVDYEWGPFSTHRLSQYNQRMAGFFGQPNAYAAFVMIAMPIPLFYAFKFNCSTLVKVLSVLIFLFLQWGVFLGVSRGALITLGIQYILYALFLGSTWKQRALTFLVFVVAAGLQFYAFSETQSVMSKRVEILVETQGEGSRNIYYPIAWEIFKDQPLFGIGEGSFRYVWDTVEPISYMVEETHVHSDPLELLAENGIVGAMLYYLPVCGVLIMGFLSLQRLGSPSQKALVQVCIIGVSGYLIHGCVDFLTKYQTLLFVSFIYLAFIAQELCWPRFRSRLLAKGVVLICGVVSFFMLFIGIASVRAMWISEENRLAKIDLDGRLAAGESVKYAEIDALYSNAALALQADPRYVPAMLQAIEALQLKAHYDPSNKIDYTDLALAINLDILDVFEGHWRAWGIRINLLEQYGGRDDEVMECYRRALAIAPQNLLLRMNYIMYLKRRSISGEVYDEQANFVRKTFPGHPALNDL